MCCTNCHLRFLGVTKMIINALFENFNGSDRSLVKNRESREKTGFWSRTEAVQIWSEKWVVPSVLPVQLAMFFPIRQLSVELICKWNILILPAPLQFLPREFLFGEFCTSLSGLRWGGVRTSHGMTLHYSFQHKMKPLHCGLWSPAKKKSFGEKKD